MSALDFGMIRRALIGQINASPSPMQRPPRVISQAVVARRVDQLTTQVQQLRDRRDELCLGVGRRASLTGRGPPMSDESEHDTRCRHNCVAPAAWFGG